MAEIIEATHNVAFVTTVAGVVADFTESVIAAMAGKIAQELGVLVGNVVIDVEAASVIITTTIGFADFDSADAAHTALSTLVGTNDAASELLSTDELAVSVESVELSKPAALGGTSEENNIYAIVGGAAGGGAVLFGLAAIIWCRKKKKPSSATTVSGEKV